MIRIILFLAIFVATPALAFPPGFLAAITSGRATIDWDTFEASEEGWSTTSWNRGTYRGSYDGTYAYISTATSVTTSKSVTTGDGFIEFCYATQTGTTGAFEIDDAPILTGLASTSWTCVSPIEISAGPHTLAFTTSGTGAFAFDHVSIPR